MIENSILGGLITDEDYTRKVAPYLKVEYFDDIHSKVVFETIISFFQKYNGLPSKEALLAIIDDRKDLNERTYSEVVSTIEGLTKPKVDNMEWLVDSTEKFCQDKALFNAIRRSISIMDGQDKELDKGSLPELLTSALAVSFDTHIGHDYLDDYEERYEYYHLKENKVEFDLELLNKITKGGISKKTLTILLAPTGVGKTMVMGHMAAANLSAGKNVLYITLEMSQEKIAERVDQNLMDITNDELLELPKDVFKKRINKIKEKTPGKLIIKEYPTGCANVNHFRHLLNELKMKKNFVPDIIYIDYLNLCSSSRIRGNAAANSYTLIKSIAEELRGLGVEFGVPIVSATQVNREGYGNSDIELTETSESIGLPATCDFMIALISTEELEKLGQLMIKQLKNRYNDLNRPRRFIIGMDRAKMKLYDVEESAQSDIISPENTPKKSSDEEKPSLRKKDRKKKIWDLDDEVICIE